MEENFFKKRLTKKQAVFRGLAIIILDYMMFFGINSLHNFTIVPLTFTLAFIGFAILMYGIYTITAPFNYESYKKYVEKQGFKIDTPYVFLYKNYLIKWGKEGAYVYQKNGIVRWVFYDTIFNNEKEVSSFLDNRNPEKGKVFDAIPNTYHYGRI